MSDTLDQVLEAIRKGSEASLMVDGKHIQRIEWELQENGFTQDSYGDGTSNWSKHDPSGVGQYRIAEIVYVSSRDVASALITKSYTSFYQYDADLRSTWTTWRSTLR